MKTIAIDEIPRASRRNAKYPWEEWLKIPAGRAVDIMQEWPDLINGRTVNQMAMSIRPWLVKAHPSLRLFARGDSLYIARVAEVRDGG